MLSMCLLHIFLYIFFINIGCASLYHISMMCVTVYNMSFYSNCRIYGCGAKTTGLPNVIEEKLLEIKRSIRRGIYIFQIRTGHFSV